MKTDKEIIEKVKHHLFQDEYWMGLGFPKSWEYSHRVLVRYARWIERAKHQHDYIDVDHYYKE